MAATTFQPQTNTSSLDTPPRTNPAPCHNGESPMAVSDVTDDTMDMDMVIKVPLRAQNSCYELPKLRPPPKDFEQVATFLQTAVNTRQNNSDPSKRPNHSSTVGYKAILDCIRQPPAQVDLSLLYKILRALQGGQILATVFSYPQIHSILIHSVFRLNILFLVDVRRNGAAGEHDDPDMHDDICTCYYHLLVGICSANTTFLIPVFEAIVKQMRYVISQEGVSLELDGSSPKTTSGDITKAQMEAQSRINTLHATIEKILILIPKGKSELFPILSKHYPHVALTPSVVRNYLIVILQQWQYCKFIRQDLLLLILKKSLDMDVEILIKDDGMVIIDPDANVEEAADDDDEAKHESMDIPRKKTKTVLDIANKLDVNMHLLFTFLENHDIYDHWKALLKFVPVLLDVHKSKFVQFCFWYLVQRDTRIRHDGTPLYREFIAELMKIVYVTISSETTTISDSTMISTASYLASFCARARFVDTDSIREVVSGLLNWALFYIQQESYNRNKLFYSVTQAVFYIMCYRGRQIMHDQRSDSLDDPHFISPEKFHFLFSCPRLNPLHHCLSSVREEFILLGKEYGLIPPAALISKENNIRKKGTAIKIVTPMLVGSRNQLGGIRSQVKVSNPLQSFFPFDPYLLKNSSAFIVDYLSWDDILQLVDDDEDETSKSQQIDNQEDYVRKENFIDQPRHMIEEDDDVDGSDLSDEDSLVKASDDQSKDTDDDDEDDDDDDSVINPNSVTEICSNERWRKASIASEGSW